MAANDPMDALMNFGANPETWALVAGPLALLVTLVAVAGVVVALRRRRERQELEAATAAESLAALAPKASRGSGRQPSSLAVSDEDAHEDGEPYPIPADLSSVELSPDERPSADDVSAQSPARSRGHLRIVPQGTSVSPLPSMESVVPSDIAEVRAMDRRSWRDRLRAGLSRTRASLTALITGKAQLDDALLDRLHEALYRADVGVQAADKLVAHVRESLGRREEVSWDALSLALKEQAQALLAPAGGTALVRPTNGPWVILVVGVNGVGKTTTIGKLAAHFTAAGEKVLLAAADTFRAAAAEQLSVWGERLGVDVIKHQPGGDPAAVAYDAIQAAKARGATVVLIDTAGRLHAKAELMAELGKISRIVGRDLPGAPHETWLVLDGTTGQNAIAQVKAFREVVGVSGLVVTKLDGTAKGGVLLAIVDQFQLPIRYLGVGEKSSDLREFDATDYVESLF